MLWDKLTVDEHFELFARAYDLDNRSSTRAVTALLEELQFERYRGYRVEHSPEAPPKAEPRPRADARGTGFCFRTPDASGAVSGLAAPAATMQK